MNLYLTNVFSYVHQGSIFDCNDDVFQRSWDINVRSMFWMVQVWNIRYRGVHDSFPRSLSVETLEKML